MSETEKQINTIVRNVREGIRTKADLKRCGCRCCLAALEILKGYRTK